MCIKEAASQQIQQDTPPVASQLTSLVPFIPSSDGMASDFAKCSAESATGRLANTVDWSIAGGGKVSANHRAELAAFAKPTNVNSHCIATSSLHTDRNRSRPLR